jgi:hypothetical protein
VRRASLTDPPYWQQNGQVPPNLAALRKKAAPFMAIRSPERIYAYNLPRLCNALLKTAGRYGPHIAKISSEGHLRI